MSKKYTIQDVFDNKVEKHFGGYAAHFTFGKYIVSIIGGKKGYYGDFKTTFEVAIIDGGTKEFVTKLFYGGDSVMAYCTTKEVEDVLNMFSGVSAPKQSGGVD